jgi:DinB superfamily
MNLCAECRFDWDTARDAAITTIATAGPRFTDALAVFDDVQVRTRPAPEVWSALEYAAHTRDTLDFYDERVRRVATEARPQLERRNVADLCDTSGYNAEVVFYSLEALTANADRFATRLRDLPDNAWDRVGIGSEGGERTLLVLARRGAHEVEHHLLDVRRVQDVIGA